MKVAVGLSIRIERNNLHVIRIIIMQHKTTTMQLIPMECSALGVAVDDGAEITPDRKKE